MTWGLIGAVISAIAYGAATILEAKGVADLRTAQHKHGWARVWAGWRYAVGLGLDGLGFLASTAALRSLPLFLVQSVIASSVAVTAVLAVKFLGARLSRKEIYALGAVGVGLVILACVAKEGSAQSPSWLGAVTLVSALGVTAVAAFGYFTKNGPLLAFAAGLGFSGVGIAARTLNLDFSPSALLTNITLWALIAHGVLATVAYAAALDVGTATSVAAITFATETVLPAAIGLAALGDEFRHGGVIPGAAGFVLTLGGCIMLARHSEQEAPAT